MALYKSIYLLTYLLFAQGNLASYPQWGETSSSLSIVGYDVMA